MESEGKRLDRGGSSSGSSETKYSSNKDSDHQVEDENAILLTPSADGILDVTPVNSYAADSPMATTTEQKSRERADLHQQATSKIITDPNRLSRSMAITSDEEKLRDVKAASRQGRQIKSDQKQRMKHQQDSKEEEDNRNEDRSSIAQHSDETSEWDKALRVGKSHKGDASDFFAAPSSRSSMDEDDEEGTDVAIETSLTTDNAAEGADAASNLSTNIEVSSVNHTSSSRAQPDLPPLSSSASSSNMVRSSSTTISLSSATGGNSNAKLRITTHSPAIVGQTNSSIGSAATTTASSQALPSSSGTFPHPQLHQQHHEHLNSGVLPDILMTMRQKIESLTMFDSDMMRLAAAPDDNDPLFNESRESLKRSSQQSISAAVLVSLAHKRYERRRLAAMEIEKVVRSLVQQGELERIRAILLLLSDDYVRSTSEDARKGGVVALAACAIGMKKVKDDSVNNNNSGIGNPETQKSLVQECRDLILASVVHACQDHSKRVRYYACENLCNTVKVIPILAIQHFFILFEILRSLYADVNEDVRKGAEILDRRIKDIVVGALNSGQLKAEACIPVFARFVYSRNKPTKRLTLTWLQEWSEKLIGSPILEYLHLFLGGIFDMIGDPTVAIRQSALAFLQSVLPKLLTLDYMDDTPMEEGSVVNFDKILQALVTTMEHPNPFVRKVAMYWMSRIVKAHIGDASGINQGSSADLDGELSPSSSHSPSRRGGKTVQSSSAASVSVRNSVPHVLPGILLSIGDTYDPSGAGSSNHPSHHNHNIKNSFLPDQTTRALAEQTNASLQEAVRRDGSSFVQHLDGFIIALREELDSPGGLLGKNAPAVERSPYRADVNLDGSGIESAGWFRGSYSNASENAKDGRPGNDDMGNNTNNSSTMVTQSRLCALHWVIVLYQYVVPDLLKADYAREFIYAIINQLVDDPPQRIVYKSLEVLATITVPVSGEDLLSTAAKKFATPSWAVASSHNRSQGGTNDDEDLSEPLPVHMTQPSLDYALEILGPEGKRWISRDRKVFAALIQMHSTNPELVADLSSVISYMCKLQPPEFVMVSFAVELDRFVLRKRQKTDSKDLTLDDDQAALKSMEYAQDLKFVSAFVQHMNHVLLNAEEARSVREVLKDSCVELSSPSSSERDRRRCRIFHILLHSWAHNLGAVLSLCLWSGAFRTASLFLQEMNPLDVNLMFLLEMDRLVELLERPLFRHLNVRMLEHDHHPQHNNHHPPNDDNTEGSGTMLFRALKSLLMILPQSTSYRVLAERLNSISRFRQSTNLSLVAAAKQHRERTTRSSSSNSAHNSKTESFVNRVLQIRAQHCEAAWQAIRAASLETPNLPDNSSPENTSLRFPNNKARTWFSDEPGDDDWGRQGKGIPPIPNFLPKEEERWKLYWAASSTAKPAAATKAAAE